MTSLSFVYTILWYLYSETIYSEKHGQEVWGTEIMFAGWYFSKSLKEFFFDFTVVKNPLKLAKKIGKFGNCLFEYYMHYVAYYNSDI